MDEQIILRKKKKKKMKRWRKKKKPRQARQGSRADEVAPPEDERLEGKKEKSDQ